jgi:hypothetical protein
MILRVQRRRIFFALLVLAALVGGLGWLVVTRDRLTQANFDRIHEDRSIDEVVAILGPPWKVIEYPYQFPEGRVCPFRYSWDNGIASADVLVDHAGVVRYLGLFCLRRTLLDRFRTWWYQRFRKDPPF